MADPYAAIISQERRQRFLGWLLVVGVTAAIFLVGTRLVQSGGELIHAEVVGFAHYATELGDRPLVKVRLSDGAIREVRVSPAAIVDCRRGDKIAVVQNGSRLRIGLRGCNI